MIVVPPAEYQVHERRTIGASSAFDDCDSVT